MAKVGRRLKELMLEELTTVLKARQTFFIASTGPLRATETDTLRKRLQGVQARMLVVKRTIGARGLSAMKFDGADALLSGAVALVLPGEDIIPAAKLLVDFAKENQEKLKVRGGWVDGQLLDQTRILEFANLPARPQLMAHLVGVLEAPMSDLVMTLEGAISELAFVLEEAGKKKPAEATAAAAPVSEAKAEEPKPEQAEGPATGGTSETKPEQQEEKPNG